MFFSIECQSLRYSSKHCSQTRLRRYSSKHCSQTRLACFYRFRSRCQVCPELFSLYLCNSILGLFYQVACLELFPLYIILFQVYLTKLLILNYIAFTIAILFQAYFTNLFVLVVVVDIRSFLLYFPYLFTIQHTFLP